MNKNAISGLTKSDVNNIQRTWTTVFKSADSHGLEVFKRLFRADPNIKKLFETVKDLQESDYNECEQFRMHVNRFMTEFNTAISKLNEPEIIVPMMKRIGNTHKTKGVQQRYFSTLRDVLYNYLNEDLKLKSKELESWERFLGFILPIIINALNKS
ncbi:hypothetical protein O0L34_g8818 [Tuta absoluta]|nr:hypothetical protein O0L34_g8818 [Tuta absoluta]